MYFQAAIVLALATAVFGIALYYSLENNKRIKKEKELKKSFS